MRAEAARLYSALSKGVHHEFVVPPATMYDRPTVRGYLGDVTRVIAQLALVSHMIIHSPYRLDDDRSIALFEIVQRLEVAS